MMWRPQITVIEDTSAAFAQRLLREWRALPASGLQTFGLGLRVGMSAAALRGLYASAADPGFLADTADPAQGLWVVLTGLFLIMLVWLSYLSVLRHATHAETNRPSWGRLLWGSLRLHVVKWIPLWIWGIGILALGMIAAPGLEALPADLAADPQILASVPWSVWLVGFGVLVGFPVVLAWSCWRCLTRLSSDGDLARGVPWAPPLRGHQLAARWWECLVVVGLTLALDAMATLGPWPEWVAAMALHAAAGLWALASVTWSRSAPLGDDSAPTDVADLARISSSSTNLDEGERPALDGAPTRA